MDIVEKSWKAQRKIEEKVKHIGKGKYGRVLKMARKPSSEEFKRVLQITSLSLTAIGALGFFIYWLWNRLPLHLSGLFG